MSAQGLFLDPATAPLAKLWMMVIVGVGVALWPSLARQLSLRAHERANAMRDAHGMEPLAYRRPFSTLVAAMIRAAGLALVLFGAAKLCAPAPSL